MRDDWDAHVVLNDGDYFFPSEPEIKKDSQIAKSLLHRLNSTDPYDVEAWANICQELLPACQRDVSIITPFYCSRGYNIRAGKNFSCDINCVILDVTDVIIGDDVSLGAHVNIYTVSHPTNSGHRNTGIEFVKQVKIGNRVRIGGQAVILPGVTIGNDVIIEAGSVVSKDIPDGCLAGGVPARVIQCNSNKG